MLSYIKIDKYINDVGSDKTIFSYSTSKLFKKTYDKSIY